MQYGDMHSLLIGQNLTKSPKGRYAVETAQANLDAVLADPSQEQLAVAQAQIDSSESAIHVLESQI